MSSFEGICVCPPVEERLGLRSFTHRQMFISSDAHGAARQRGCLLTPTFRDGDKKLYVRCTRQRASDFNLSAIANIVDLRTATSSARRFSGSKKGLPSTSSSSDARITTLNHNDVAERAQEIIVNGVVVGDTHRTISTRRCVQILAVKWSRTPASFM